MYRLRKDLFLLGGLVSSFAWNMQNKNRLAGQPNVWNRFFNLDIFSGYVSVSWSYSHCVPLSHQERHDFTLYLPSLSFASMHFHPWLVVTHHYGWGRKRGLLKWMVSKLFAFCSIKKSLGAASVLTSTSWHLYHIMVHGLFWGCLVQQYQAASEQTQVLPLSLCCRFCFLTGENKRVFTTPWHFKQLQHQQKSLK